MFWIGLFVGYFLGFVLSWIMLNAVRKWKYQERETHVSKEEKNVHGLSTARIDSAKVAGQSTR